MATSRHTPEPFFKTIRAAIDYQRPKYANFAHFHKKDALTDNGEHRDLRNDLEPLPLPMNRRLHRVDLRWIKCVTAPYDSDLEADLTLDVGCARSCTAQMPVTAYFSPTDILH
ncbi:hypothetical protein K438DRAFT_1775289 [Mycena galopus ATCC 62051]|nr:hypothetical protein K438DRAFT_1775289 [Mycena galopus ATCC 62051]